MKRTLEKPLYLISPSIPSLCVDISSYEDMETLEDAWRVFGDSKDDQDVSDITAVKGERLLVGKEIKLSTKISDFAANPQGPKLIIFHKDNSKRFIFWYRIDGLSTDESCGSIGLSLNNTINIPNLVLHILLKHSLLYDILDPLPSDTYILGVELSNSKIKYFTHSEENWHKKVSREHFMQLFITKEAKFVIESDDAISPQIFTIPASILNSNNIALVKRHIRDLRRDALKIGATLKLIEEYKNVQELLDDICTEGVIWKKRACDFPIELSLEESTFEHYESVADKIVSSPEWEDYFRELSSKLQEFKTIHVFLPKSCGKTQLAFNLSRHYKVIYLSCKNMFKSSAKLLEAIKEVIEVDRNEENVLLSELKASFNLYGPGPAVPVGLRLRTNNGLIRSISSNTISIFVRFMENIYGRSATLSDWIKYGFQNDAVDLNSAITINEFKEKYGSVLKNYVIYIDDYGWKDSFVSTKNWIKELEVHRFIKYLGIALGLHVVTSGSSLIDTDNNIVTEYDLRENEYKLKWSSILTRPFPFSIKYFENSWEEERLQSTLTQDIAGDPASIQAIAVFLLEHLSSESPEFFLLIYNALKKAMEKLEDAKKSGNRIPFEKFRDTLFREAHFSIIQKLEYENPSFETVLSFNQEVELNVGTPAITLGKNMVNCGCQGSDETCNTGFFDIYVEYDQEKLYKGAYLEGCRNHQCHQLATSDIWKNDVFLALSHVVETLKYGRNVDECIKNDLSLHHISLSFIYHSLKIFSEKLFSSQPLETFLNSFIVEFPRGEYDKLIASNVIYPAELSELISNIQIPCFSPINVKGSNLLEKIFPNSFGKFTKEGAGVNRFEYFENGEKKTGTIQTIDSSTSSPEAFDTWLASLSSVGSQVNLLLCKNDTLDGGFVDCLPCKTEICDKITQFLQEKWHQPWSDIRYHSGDSSYSQLSLSSNYGDREKIRTKLCIFNSLNTVKDSLLSSISDSNYISIKKSLIGMLKGNDSVSDAGNFFDNKYYRKIKYVPISDDDSTEVFEEWKIKWANFNVYYLFIPILEGCTFYPLHYKPENTKVILILPLL